MSLASWWPSAILVVTVMVAARPGQPSEPELLPLPEPGLAGVEEGVRRQLVERRASLAARIASGAEEDASLALAYGKLGQLYFTYDLLDAAEPCLLDAAALQPDGFSWHYLLGALYGRTGEADRAIERLLTAAALKPDDAPTRLRLGRLYLDLGRLDEAENQFTRALALDPRSAAAHHGLGRIAQERGEWRGSLEHLERALELQPTASSIHYLLGVAYRELGDLDAALRHLEGNDHDPVLFADPEVDGLDALIESGRYYVKLGDLARGRGHYARAVSAYREAVARSPDDALAHYDLGVTLVETGARSEGLGHLEEAVRLDPGYRDAHFNLGVVLAEADRLEEAERHFARVLEIDPADEEARLARARALSGLARLALESGDRPAAVEHLRAAVRVDPRTPGGFLTLGTVLGQEGDFAAAAQALRHAVELDPRSFSARFGQAMALLLSGQAAQARHALEEGLGFTEGDLALRHLLARVLATAADPGVRDGARALEIAAEVYTERPTADHAETVAMARAEMGDFDGAVEWQHRALGLAVDEPPSRRAALERRLEAYRRGEPVRAPWLGG